MDLSLLDLGFVQHVQQIVEQKNKMEKIAQQLSELNLYFLQLAEQELLPSLDLIKRRKKLRARFNAVQDVYLTIIKNLPDHREIFKKVRLGNLKLELDQKN